MEKFDIENTNESLPESKKNLSFLRKWLNCMGISNTVASEAIGMTSNGFRYLLKKDDMKISKAKYLMECFGYTFDVVLKKSFSEIDGNVWIKMPANINMRTSEINKKNLLFLEIALKRDGITHKEAAEKLGISRMCFQSWIKKDDIAISKIYKIADVFGYQIVFEIKEKDSVEK